MTSGNSFHDLPSFNAAMEKAGIRYRLRRDQMGYWLLVAPDLDGTDQAVGFSALPHEPLEGVLTMALVYVSGAIAGARIPPT